MSTNKTRILLTGPPGVGKTTLTKKICDRLKEKVSVHGFYTQELRVGGQRQGFDVITLDGKISTFAKKSNLLPDVKKKNMPTVSQYSVDVPSFESVAIPSIKDKDGGVLVIDEIGKMELFSREFTSCIQHIFEQSNIHILATIPSLEGRGRPPPFVEQLVKRNDVKVVTVSKNNRDELANDITKEYLATL